MDNERINVTKTFLPPKEEYDKYTDKIWKKAFLTNQGPLLCELEENLKGFLDCKNFHYVANGTIALQLALNSLDIKGGEIITTPFSYVATISSILWERCKPVFVDIEPGNLTIDVNKIEEAITPQTKAIMPVHVFGYACKVEDIESIALKHNLKVIYDAAHAFGSKYKNKSLLTYGDISTCSFHATKIFHTTEGGACIVQDETVSSKLDLAKKFGHLGDRHFQLGINAKNSEFHAAMGLANFPYISHIISERKRISLLYDELLPELQKPKKQKGLEYNYAYYPVIFKSEEVLLRVFEALALKNIFPRRYFYPSLNKLSYVKGASCPISEDICLRVACLPLFVGMTKELVMEITNTIKGQLR